jgi:8-oxo-dGTP pyrophosphatase MutT (NUDIX family)
MRKIGEETEVGTIVAERRVFNHPFFPVVSRVVKTPDGTMRDEQLLWDRYGKKFIIAVVTDQEGRYVLVEEPKYGCMKRMISAPTGGMKKCEYPLDAAKREFLEETGYEAGGWRFLKATSPIVDFADKSDGGEHLIVVANNAHRVADPKNPEQKVHVLSMDEIITDYMEKGLMPAISMAALLFDSERCRRGLEPVFPID